MSTEGAATVPGEANATPAPARPDAARWDRRTTQIVRFALGSTLAAAIAYAFEWPLFFLTPVLTMVFLSGSFPGVTDRPTRLIAYVVGAVSLGTMFTLFLLPYPLVYVSLLGLALFHLYYLANRGGPFIFVLMSLLAVLILPMMGVADERLALGFAGYFAFGVVLAIVIFAICHALLPDPPGAPLAPTAAFQPGYSKPAARAALKSTIVVLPLVIAFIALELRSQVLVMVFAAVFSLMPEVSAGRAMGSAAFRSTLLGCLAAILIYWLMVAVPEFHFFLALWFVTMVVFACFIFSEHPLAKYMGSAATAMAILVSGSLGAEADFVDNMLVRVLLIMLATFYVAGALAMIDRFFFTPENRSAA